MMFSTAILAFVAFVAAQSPDPSIVTPAGVVQCQPVLLSWTASKTPVFISIIPGGQAGASPLEDLGSQSGSSMTWKADIAAGTQVTFQIRDSAGVVAYSAPVSIQPNSDSSCIGQGQPSGSSGTVSPTATGSATAIPSSVSVSVSSVASSAASSISSSVLSSIAESTSSVVASASSVIASATSTRPASSSSTRSAASATSATPAASASTTPNAARSNAQVGFAGLLGLVAAAVVMA